VDPRTDLDTEENVCPYREHKELAHRPALLRGSSNLRLPIL